MACAQEAKSDSVVPWIFQCGASGTEAPLQCRMTQEFFSSETKQRVVALTVMQGAASGFEMTLALPHGPLLPPGLALKIDEQDAVVIAIESSSRAGDVPAIESSNAAGVFARVPLDGDLGTAVKKGKIMSIGVTNRLGKLVQVPVSLAGFSAALKRLAALK